MAVAHSSSGGIALRYVLPVLWMTSRLAVVGRVSVQGLSVAKYSAPRGVARLGRSLMSMNALFCWCCVCQDR